MSGVPIKTALFEYLNAQSAFTTLVGKRFWPNAAPHGHGKHPYVVYRRRDYEAEHHLGGHAGLARCNLIFEVYATSSLDAGTIAETLRTLLDAMHDEIGATAPVYVQRCHLNDQQDEPMEPRSNGEVTVHRTTLDFEVHYNEALPTAPRN